jgi:dienelactone hydrolase
MRFLGFLLLAGSLFAQLKLIPPPGIEIPADQRQLLVKRLAELDAALQPSLAKPLVEDVLIFREAVAGALEFNEFFKLDEAAKAQRLLDEGLLRARQLAAGQSPWNSAKGLVVRGYRSEIDGSIQPYGLVIGEQLRAPGRLDLWFHGRNETMTELNFLYDRLTKPGEFTPADAIVLHLFGRYCNASKFAGETDLFEAMASVKRHYRIDEDRIFVRGFSMGGASSWHIGAHFAGLWAGVAPGAGFAESSEYQNLAAKPARPWYEVKLFSLYDATQYALNFFNTPVIAYSGEKDKQIQAAQIMARFLRQEGMELAHVIGPDTEHKYHPASKIEIAERLDALARHGRDPYPAHLKFTTHTLRYNKMRWLELLGLEQHWEAARAEARITPGGIEIQTKNVSALAVNFGSGGWPGPLDQTVSVRWNGKLAGELRPRTDRSLQGSFALHESGLPEGLHKRPQLQGPIDDAFYSKFIMVLPTGEAMSPALARWVKSESEAAIAGWRRIFRGKPYVKKDTEITEEDIRTANLVLWGDPRSNRLLARIHPQLPFADQFAANQAVVMIYPNPLNPQRYVVLNSGPTLRGEANGTNSLQTPKLPDWAVIDLTEAPSETRPGRIVAADFFDERWAVKKRP